MEIGDVIKYNFEVEDIKEGGMGVIYICRGLKESVMREQPAPGHQKVGESDRFTDFRLVWKSMRTNFFLTGLNADSFKQEALIWATLLPHPYVVSCASVDNMGTAPALFLSTPRAAVSGSG